MAVDEHDPRRGNRGEQRRIDGNRTRRAEAAALELAQRGVFPGLGARRRQAILEQLVELGAARGVAVEFRREGIEQGAHQAAPRPAWAAAPGAMRCRIQL